MTSVRGLFPVPKPSIESRKGGEDARDDVELPRRECPPREKVGDEASDAVTVDELENC